VTAGTVIDGPGDAPLPATLPISRPPAATLFFITAAATLTIFSGINYLGTHPIPTGLTTIYVVLFERLDYWGTVALLLILICAALIPAARIPCSSILRYLGDHPNIVAGCSFVMLCAGALLVYQNHPLAMDEYAQFFQSRVFAGGHLAGHFPAPLLDWLIPEGFQNYFLFVSKQTGAVASAYWPGFALLLTPFTFAGIPWACNPLISSLTLIVVHRLALRLFDDREAAGLAVLLTIASPVFFANGISYYSMPAHLLANASFALLLTDPTPRRTFAAGLVGSVALTLHNPVPHMLFALPWLIWLATRPRGIRLLAVAGAGYLPLCILFGLGWFWFTVTLRETNLNAATAASAQLEHVQRLGQAFALPDSKVFLARLIGFAKIWVWAVPGLLVLAGVGVWRQRANVSCRLFLACALTTFIGFMFIPVDQGHGWGFRYFHTAWIALPLLAAGAMTHTADGTQRAGFFAGDETRGFIVACALLTLLFGVGFRAWQIHDFMTKDLAQLPAYAGTGRRVVILDPALTFYGADLVQNDPWLRGEVTLMITRGDPDDEMMMRAHFPEMHRVYADRFGVVWSETAAPR
jgi:hypothetical protein